MAEIVAHYEIGEKLGEGGAGAVYRAYDTRLGCDVALRLLPERLSADPRWSARFEREANAAASFHHPGFCHVYEVGESGGRRYVATELPAGQTLRRLLAARDGRPLPPEQILRIGAEVAEALDAAAAHGLVHGRLTPSNILLADDGHVKILDLGLVRPADGARAGRDGGDDAPEIPPEYRGSVRTRPAAFPCMSPEQAHGEEPDARSDLFSLGATLYELATGVPAFAGGDAPMLFQEILTKNPAPPDRSNPELGRPLSELILRLLEKDRRLRYQSAADVAAELKRIGNDRKRRDEEALQEGGGADAARGDRAGAAARGRPFRRSALPLSLGALVAVAVALALMRAAAAPDYIPCIEFAPFGDDGGTGYAAAAEDILRQAVSQFPDIRVLTPDEFAHLRENTLGRDALAPAGAGRRRSLPERLGVWRRAEPEPALRVAGVVRGGGVPLEVRLDCTVRGRRRTLAAQFAGTDDFLNRAADLLAGQVLELWAPGDGERLRGAYRPAAQLLSPRWDAIDHYARGAEAWRRLNIGEAERELRAALAIDPNFALAHLALGKVRIFQNQWDAAQSEILAARRRASTLTEADQWRVEALLARVFVKPLDERRYLQKVIDLQPYRQENVYELAESYFHTADADEAVERYMEALKLAPDYAPAWNHLAYCYSWKGEHDRAVASGKRYLELDRSANAADSLGDAYMQAGDYGNARAMKLEALALDPQIHYATRTLAFIDALHGDFAAAKGKLQSLLDVTDDRVQAAQYYADLGFLHYRARKFEEAERLCARGLRLLEAAQYEVPHDELTWIRGLVAVARGDLAAARAALGKLRVLLDVGAIDAANYKPAYKYWLHLGAAVLAEEVAAGKGDGKRAEAVALLNDLNFIKDKLGYWSTPYDCAFFMDAAGQLYRKMGLARQAEDAFRAAVAYNRNLPAGHLHLAEVLLYNGAQDEARTEIELFRAAWRDADGVFPETLDARRIAGD
ncbi:MAG: protein kinase [Acidobacteriota bacterium]|jgi:tetratricopeptide (TPR) repeat protein|nr:protein kinase [Acidobacteriota bacterium]